MSKRLVPVECSTDVELLEILVGSGQQRINYGNKQRSTIASALTQVGGLGAMSRLTPEALQRRTGLSRLSCLRVAVAVELGLRALSSQREQEMRSESIRSWIDVVAWARPKLAALEHEEVWLLSLDGSHRLKDAQRVALGGAGSCSLTPADVLRPAVRNGARAAVLVHNHPSGDPTPSAADLQMTQALFPAFELVGVSLLDHVIVAHGGQRSIGAQLESNATAA